MPETMGPGLRRDDDAQTDIIYDVISAQARIQDLSLHLVVFEKTPHAAMAA